MDIIVYLFILVVLIVLFIVISKKRNKSKPSIDNLKEPLVTKEQKKPTANQLEYWRNNQPEYFYEIVEWYKEFDNDYYQVEIKPFEERTKYLPSYIVKSKLIYVYIALMILAFISSPVKMGPREYAKDTQWMTSSEFERIKVRKLDWIWSTSGDTIVFSNDKRVYRKKTFLPILRILNMTCLTILYFGILIIMYRFKKSKHRRKATHQVLKVKEEFKDKFDSISFSNKLIKYHKLTRLAPQSVT